MKWINFKSWSSGELSKNGHHFNNKIFENWRYQKMPITKNLLLNSMKKKLRKIRMIFDIENWLWKPNFGTFYQLAINPKLKIQYFPLGMSILWQKSFWIIGTYLKKIPTKLLSYTCWISKTLNHEIGATIIEGFNTTRYPGVELETIAGSPEKINKQNRIYISFSSSNTKFYESRISISPI